MTDRQKERRDVTLSVAPRHSPAVERRLPHVFVAGIATAAINVWQESEVPRRNIVFRPSLVLLFALLFVALTASPLPVMAQGGDPHMRQDKGVRH